MNYLAHLYLAGDHPESRVGALMGDFVKGNVDPRLSPRLRAGILQHRRIDVYTDAHPVTAISRRRIQPPYRRYAGILVDVYYDHFLARHWDRYSALPLRAFTRAAYGALEAYFPQLPPAMGRRVSHMLATDLLMSYREIDGVAQALRGIHGRLKRDNPLDSAIGELIRLYPQLEGDFQVFFPQLVDYAAGLKTHQEA